MAYITNANFNKICKGLNPSVVISDEEVTIEEMFKYWEMPDEFAANIWAVNFINKNISEVERLVNIFLKYQMM
jgi:hypothetical protein